MRKESIVGWGLMVLLNVLPAISQGADLEPRDAYLSGYLNAILDTEFKLPQGSYHLEVHHGDVHLELSEQAYGQHKQIYQRLMQVPTLEELDIKPFTAAVQENGRATTELNGQTQFLPRTNLFHALLADPKTPRFFVSYLSYDSNYTVDQVGSVGLGENIGLVRWRGAAPGDGLQLGLDAGVFAQFDMGSSSPDLINADYLVGLHLDHKSGPFEGRLRIYHQSSHVGDDYLQSHPSFENHSYSYEAMQLIGAWWYEEHVRLYGGGEYLIHRVPDDVERGRLLAGIEYFGPDLGGHSWRPIAAVGLRSDQQQDWYVDTNVRAGLEFSPYAASERHLRLLADYYHGYSPFGQFYDHMVTYYGVALELGL